MRRYLLLLAALFALAVASGQNQRFTQGAGAMGGPSAQGSQKRGGLRGGASADSLSSKDKEIPKGVKVWTVDERFGDVYRTGRDTITHMFMNTVFTDGVRGEYNTTGNLGSPRQNRIFTLRDDAEDQFLFLEPYDYFNRRPSSFLFTNTLSPLANLTYYTCGNRMNGEDHFKAKFAVNPSKELGAGFSVDYLYGRGYYSDQSTSLFNFNLFTSYLGERYQAHFLATTNRQKLFENGGISDDMYITHPESFDDNYATSEIPTILSNTWNRNSNQHIFLSHRYNIGFNRRVPMTEEEISARKFAIESEKENARRREAEERRQKGEEVDEDEEEEPAFAGRPDNAAVAQGDEPEATKTASDRLTLDVATADSLSRLQAVPKEEEWMKNEYVPVTSFIHTLRLDNYKRLFKAYSAPTNFYATDHYNPYIIGGDSIADTTQLFRLRNTVAMSMLEGFNKWVLAGLKFYASSDLRRYALPDEAMLTADPNAEDFSHGLRLRTHTDHNLSVGAQLLKQQGSTLHYNLLAETCVLGDEIGQVKIDGAADLNFRLFGDTLTLAASGFFHNQKPAYYLRHYHSRHFWWDKDLSMMTHTRLQGLFRYRKTHTTIRAAADALTNYSYLATTYERPTTTTITDYNLFVRQASDPISVLTLELSQDFTFGPVNWESQVTYQKSTKQVVLPLPTLNIYTNLFLKFRIAKVLQTELGADLRYFTRYEAPEYAPAVGQYVVQENAEPTKLGNYPLINAYANFNLKGTRFFVMYTRAYSPVGPAFASPHYPHNPSVLRIGISWDFYN